MNFGKAKIFNLKNDTQIVWGDVKEMTENPARIREKYNKKYKETDYTRTRLRAFLFLGYTHARVKNGRTVVYGNRIEPRHADFLELDNKEKEYKIADILNAIEEE